MPDHAPTPHHSLATIEADPAAEALCRVADDLANQPDVQRALSPATAQAVRNAYDLICVVCNARAARAGHTHVQLCTAAGAILGRWQVPAAMIR
jgi:hypothetical protein